MATAGYRWVVSTDPFGTDLAVEPPRRGIPVVTRMLVAVRWMARETGWIPGVTDTSPGWAAATPAPPGRGGPTG